MFDKGFLTRYKTFSKSCFPLVHLKPVSVQNQPARHVHLGRPLCTPAWGATKSLLQNPEKNIGFPYTAQDKGHAMTSQVFAIFNF